MKRRLLEETKKLGMLFAYFALFLGGFATYRRLILAEHGIGYFQYGYSLVEALVLAKIIMLGDLLRLGRRLNDRPLAFSTFYKTVLFSLLVLVFTIGEHVLLGLLKGKGPAEAFQEMLSKGRNEIIAQTVVMFAAFVPLFVVREIGRVMGEGKLFELFFRRRRPAM